MLKLKCALELTPLTEHATGNPVYDDNGKAQYVVKKIRNSTDYLPGEVLGRHLVEVLIKSDWNVTVK